MELNIINRVDDMRKLLQGTHTVRFPTYLELSLLPRLFTKSWR
jgi:hypothetical protein